MNISVIIPTFNGAKKIISVLQSLQNQSVKDFEVIVIIDGSTDETFKILQQRTFDFSPFKIINQANQGRAGSRNRGAKEAKGDLLVFFDDDMRLQPDCLQMHQEHHQNHVHTLAIGNVPEQPEQMQTDFQRYKAFLSQKWTAPLHHNPLIPKDKPYLTAANFSVSSALFQKLGGFDERLSDAEDFDLAMQASEADIPIYFLSKAIAWHDDFVSCQSYIRRLRQYRKAHQALKTIKPQLYSQFNHFEPVPIQGWKKRVYSFFADSFWVKLTDQEKILFLPKKIRYRFYDLLTTALGVYFVDKQI
jgi:glycosyltransferase involved in cell wall biosynthesis